MSEGKQGIDNHNLVMEKGVKDKFSSMNNM